MTPHQSSRDRDLDPAERWLIVDGRRWRRTDPVLDSETVASLRSQLGRGRAAVKSAKAADDDAALEQARRRVQLAKLGLGERGPYWWDRPVAERREQARHALDLLHR